MLEDEVGDCALYCLLLTIIFWYPREKIRLRLGETSIGNPSGSQARIKEEGWA